MFMTFARQVEGESRSARVGAPLRPPSSSNRGGAGDRRWPSGQPLGGGTTTPRGFSTEHRRFEKHLGRGFRQGGPGEDPFPTSRYKGPNWSSMPIRENSAGDRAARDRVDWFSRRVPRRLG